MSQNQPSGIRNLLEIFRKGSAFVILILIAGGFAIMSDQFLTINNLLTVALQTSIIALVGIGMTFTIITGGIDLSVGSVAALCGALAAGLATRNGLGTYPAILIALVAGVAVGALNGAMVVYGRIPPFVATLASMAIARGLTLVYTSGKPISGIDESFTFWADSVMGIPVPLILLIVVAIITYVVLSHSAFGLHVFAIGGGEETARLATVPAKKVKMSVYMISSLLAAVAGIILTARLWSAQPNSGTGLELDAIAAAVLGGTSLAGGTGSITGTTAGAFIIGVLSNGLNLLEVPSYSQQVVKGLVFIFAVLLDYFLKRRMKATA
ncbi:MAG: ABC transporter permease [Anaerolineaceae bacterium]